VIDGGGGAGLDFFVSYTGVDRAWAEWIAWVLEDHDYGVKVQAWDFGVGSHFVAEMQRAAVEARRTIAVLSAAYLGSKYASPEWQAAWGADPTGESRKLLVFRVEDCARPGLLAQVVSEDLFGVDRSEARRRLLAAAKGERRKPTAPPPFPGSAVPVIQPNNQDVPEPTFPPDGPIG
jgi:hypothetical protein